MYGQVSARETKTIPIWTAVRHKKKTGFVAFSEFFSNKTVISYGLNTNVVRSEVFNDFKSSKWGLGVVSVPKQFFDLETMDAAYDFWANPVLDEEVVSYVDSVYYDFLGERDPKGALIKTIMHSVGSSGKKKTFARAFTMEFGDFIFVVAKRTDSSTMISFLNGPTDMFESRQPLREEIYSVQKSFLHDGDVAHKHAYSDEPLESDWVVPYVFPFGWFATREDIAMYFPAFAKYSSVFRPEITKESIPVLTKMLNDLNVEINLRVAESDRQYEDRKKKELANVVDEDFYDEDGYSDEEDL